MKKMNSFIVFVLLLIVGFYCYKSLMKEERLVRRIIGNYQIVEENTNQNGKWHLYIGTYQNQERYFTIYDNGGKIGNKEYPWIVGWIEKVEKGKIIIKIDEKLFLSMPSEWKLENKKLVLNYKKKKDILVLTNEGFSMKFKKQKLETN